MTDTTFRSKQEPAVEPVSKAEKETRSGDEGEKIEVPYLDYKKENNHPYSADYFKLGSKWDDPEGGFPEELSMIEEYFNNKIESGEMANSIDSVKRELGKIEKLNNLKYEDRSVVKIEIMAAYVKFLMESDKIKYKVIKREHGNN